MTARNRAEKCDGLKPTMLGQRRDADRRRQVLPQVGLHPGDRLPVAGPTVAARRPAGPAGARPRRLQRSGWPRSRPGPGRRRRSRASANARYGSAERRRRRLDGQPDGRQQVRHVAPPRRAATRSTTGGRRRRSSGAGPAGGMISTWPGPTSCRRPSSSHHPAPSAHMITIACAAPARRTRPCSAACGKYPASVTSRCEVGVRCNASVDQRAGQDVQPLARETVPQVHGRQTVARHQSNRPGCPSDSAFRRGAVRAAYACPHMLDGAFDLPARRRRDLADRAGGRLERAGRAPDLPARRRPTATRRTWTGGSTRARRAGSSRCRSTTGSARRRTDQRLDRAAPGERVPAAAGAARARWPDPARRGQAHRLPALLRQPGDQAGPGRPGRTVAGRWRGVQLAAAPPPGHLPADGLGDRRGRRHGLVLRPRPVRPDEGHARRPAAAGLDGDRAPGPAVQPQRASRRPSCGGPTSPPRCTPTTSRSSPPT